VLAALMGQQGWTIETSVREQIGGESFPIIATVREFYLTSLVENGGTIRPTLVRGGDAGN